MKKINTKSNIRKLENEFYDTHVAYSIVALANLITLNTMKSTLTGTGLSVNEWRILRMAFIYESICAADVINLFGLDKTTTGRAISRLQKAKLVKLRVDKQDKRQTNVSVSAAGKKLHDKIVRRDNISDASLEKILSQRELRSFHGVMQKLRMHVNEMLDVSA